MSKDRRVTVYVLINGICGQQISPLQIAVTSTFQLFEILFDETKNWTKEWTK